MIMVVREDKSQICLFGIVEESTKEYFLIEDLNTHAQKKSVFCINKSSLSPEENT